MSEFSKRLLAANKVEAVNIEGIDHYRFVHGRQPTGIGNWFFCKDKTMDLDVHKKGKDYIETPRLSFSEARDYAAKWAKEHGYRTIYLQT